MKKIMEWVIAAIIMGAIVFFLYLTITPSTGIIKATIIIGDTKTNSSIMRTDDVDISIRGESVVTGKEYWIYIDTR